jgi:hypothetical protein
MQSPPLYKLLRGVAECDDELLQRFCSLPRGEHQIVVMEAEEGAACGVDDQCGATSTGKLPNCFTVCEGDEVEVFWLALRSWYKARVLHVLGKSTFRVHLGEIGATVIADVRGEQLRRSQKL